ncbi:hypothetical protein HJC23_005210 [Cyclotella cryptica]|uniref:WW domain-containing protein n=1 Tax=Cyclotella cryptica TaxID=29204 RepID=A0ABD3P529_9STRA|eukprot:CCRYP_017805-RA/>CCRYP_017805-RA protein AED:0.29 eAED:0.29 QI:0/-1/0/1/-1/1/1/0/419
MTSKSSFTVFNEVDESVAKPVLGSDGAARWQDFRKDAKKVITSTSVAPLLPLKRLDRALGTSSINDERAIEAKIRSEAGDRELGAGYTDFKRKGDHEEAAARKKRKLILDRVRPDDALYFIEAETFEGFKFDYVFTTRDRGTGYYWDGMDSRNKELGRASAENDSDKNNNGDVNGEDASGDAKTKSVVKTKKKKKKSKEHLIEALVPESDPYNPIEQVAAAIMRRNQALAAPPTAFVGASTIVSDAVALGANAGALINSTAGETLEPELVAAGWESAKDPNSGKIYYFQRSTNERRWNKPSVQTQSLGTSTVVSDALVLGASTATLLPSKVEETLEPELITAGWEVAKDSNSGKTYFFRRSTNERSWTKPSVLSKADDDDNDQLPGGWKSAKDPNSGKIYYFDGSGNTTWKRPEPKAAS